jgi:hypothetical protein
MDEWLSRLENHEGLVLALTCISIAMFVGSLLMVPWLVARAPRDVFRRPASGEGPKRALAVTLLKNLCGVLLLLAGLLMLVLPGQGILTILIGVVLLDIPAKHTLIVKLARRPGVMRSLNYLRRRARREPFEPPV